MREEGQLAVIEESCDENRISFLKTELVVLDKKLDSINRGNPNNYELDELQYEKYDLLSELEELEDNE